MAMTINQRTAATFLGATGVTCVAAATYLLTTGIDDETITLALRMSGRVAFAVLIVAFAARPLRQLLKAPWTAKLLRNRRQVGVAFAGIHTAHLGLILMRASDAAARDVQVLATIAGHSGFAHEPEWFTTAPVSAINALHKKLGWSADSVDLYEINEAFACVTLS